jgi:hypothetical protein
MNQSNLNNNTCNNSNIVRTNFFHSKKVTNIETLLKFCMQYQNLLKCAPAIESLAKVAIFEIFATKLQTIVKIEIEKNGFAILLFSRFNSRFNLEDADIVRYRLSKFYSRFY